MATEGIKFRDGAAYERYMGVWSRQVGEAFLGWIDPPPGLRWLDVGCGSGAFTELIAERCAPASLDGIDPSEEQLAFARKVPALASAAFRTGDAMALPYPDGAFDAAVMPLVIFFVPEPAKGVAEMVRVVRPGGMVTAYAWDMPGGGFPYAALIDEMESMGIEVPKTPRPEASSLEVLRELWDGAGLAQAEVRAFRVERTFPDFETYWGIVEGGPNAGQKISKLPAGEKGILKERVRKRLWGAASGPITLSARCHAVRGRVAKA